MKISGKSNIRNNLEISAKLKKIFVLIPDGVGLRNFVYSSFPEIAAGEGMEIVYWNQTSKNLKKEGLQEIKLKGKPGIFTDLFKRAKIENELNCFKERFKDPVYDTYKFPSSSVGIKNKLKNRIVRFLIGLYPGQKGVRKLQEKMEQSERRSFFYSQCRTLLEKEKPALLFCTNQRPIKALAPILAARDLGIKTGCFIFSWDNLPKATKIMNTDYYFVWSELMKDELLKYYPDIQPEQIKITGSPQFEVHFENEYKWERKQFFDTFGLDNKRKYLCFSGDDITTSPGDHEYLEDVARAVEKLNSQGENLGIIFRRSPVDLSDRYDRVLDVYKSIITPIAPAWEKKGDNWNEVIPKEEDQTIQANTIAHSFMVINLGSSMVFDYASYSKPCAFINYNPGGAEMLKDVAVIYDYVHFRSMPEGAVYWINDRNEVDKVIKQVLELKAGNVIQNAEVWFKRINKQPADKATDRISNYLKELIKN
ncbi:UDP-glycosyltransferase [Salinimicrobium flavum]|uniref:UDP-glycosyltransferase n=1 Tax=Salinimicrobium flavum TaxID=1737065 RepID=A0ABW5J0E1_9FLAO